MTITETSKNISSSVVVALFKKKTVSAFYAEGNYANHLSALVEHFTAISHSDAGHRVLDDHLVELTHGAQAAITQR